MLIYDAQLPVLDDSFAGDEVALLAVRDGKVDRAFRRNYAWAKHAANAGKLKKFTVVVEVGTADWIHTVGAVQSALTGALLHPAGAFDVRCVARSLSVAQTARVVADKLASWETAPAPVVVEQAPASKPQPKPRLELKPKAEDEKGDKVEDSGA